jgi:ferredoxin/flavodoxin
MKVGIFYQSVTGNTKHVAELIEQGLREAGHSCEILNIHGLDLPELRGYDLLGFGAPVFAWREPKLMKKFVADLPDLEGKDAFLFCTCNGNAGNFAPRVAKNLKKKGIQVFATATFYYPSSYTVWRKPEGNKDIITQEQIDKAIAYGTNLAAELEAIKQGKKSLPKLKKSIKVAIVGNISSDWALRIYLGTINVNEEVCTKCGKCVKICPHDAISLDPFPVINAKLCTGCCGCINVCPVRALDSKKSKGKEQYIFKESLIES